MAKLYDKDQDRSGQCNSYNSYIKYKKKGG